MKLTTEQEKLFETWYLDPDKFCRDMWPHHTEQPEVWQTEASRLVAANDRVSIRSGHGVGKTCWLARTIIWWGLTRNPWKIGCTAPSSGQMFDALWSELAQWHQKMPPEFKGFFEWKAERFEWVGSGAVSYAVAKTARRETPEALAGLHSKNMLFIIDEASGVDDIIFETARGAMSTKNAKTIMTGNPTRLSGYFYDSFHKNAPYWKNMRVAAHESTRCNLAELAQWEEEYGKDSNFYRVRALGEFPDAEDGTIIPLYLVDAAAKRDVEPVPSEEVWGLDVSGAGSDQCALAKRRGNILIEPIKVWRSDDTMVSVGKVMAEFRDAKNKPVQINVDSNGIGAGVAHRLAEQGVPVHCVRYPTILISSVRSLESSGV